MSIFHRIPLRALLTSSIVALALGGCSFHYSSGSSAPSSGSSGGSSVKPVNSSTSSTKVDNRVKPIKSTDTKPVKKVDATPDPVADTPAKVDPPKRNLPADDATPTRTTGAPKRTPAPPARTQPTDDAGQAGGDSPASSTTFKAKTKPKAPPADNDTLVAPQ
jgi:hypothetical protein